LLLMLAAVQLDDQPLFQAHIIGHVRAQRMLPPELELLQVPIPEQSPKPQLGISQGLA